MLEHDLHKARDAIKKELDGLDGRKKALEQSLAGIEQMIRKLTGGSGTEPGATKRLNHSYAEIAKAAREILGADGKAMNFGQVEDALRKRGITLHQTPSITTAEVIRRALNAHGGFEFPGGRGSKLVRLARKSGGDD